MTTKTHFSFRIDEWDDAGNVIVDHLAGADNVFIARGAYQAACETRPGRHLTLRQGARILAKTRK